MVDLTFRDWAALVGMLALLCCAIAWVLYFSKRMSHGVLSFSPNAPRAKALVQGLWFASLPGGVCFYVAYAVLEGLSLPTPGFLVVSGPTAVAATVTTFLVVVLVALTMKPSSSSPE